ATSPAAAAPMSTKPAPCDVIGSPTSGRALPTSRPASASAPSDGRAWARSAAAPATVAAAALEPLTVTKRGEPSALAPGSDVASATPGPTRSGFTRPSNARPADEKLATRPCSTFGVRAAARRATATRCPRARRASAACAAAVGIDTTGTEIASSRPRPPAASVAWPPYSRTAEAPAAEARAAAGPGDVSVAGGRAPVVPGRGDDEGVERERAGCGAGLRPVCERRERLRQRDEGNPRRVVRVAVVVGVDRTLEPGDDLVAARVDRPVPERVPLPACDPDRPD